MSKKSGNASETRIDFQSQLFLENYGMTEKNKFCMLTGNNGKITLAHLLPVCTKPDIAKSLSMEGRINDFRNCLLLSNNIEKAFDEQRISFVPSSNPLQSNEFIMKVWDAEVLTWNVFKKGTDENTISRYASEILKLNMPNGTQHQPFKRCLSFHNFMCFMKWSLWHGELKESIDNFGFQHTGTWLVDRQYYLDNLNTRLAQETAQSDGGGSDDE